MSNFFFVQAKTVVKVACDFADCIFRSRFKFYLSADDTSRPQQQQEAADLIGLKILNGAFHRSERRIG